MRTEASKHERLTRVQKDFRSLVSGDVVPSITVHWQGKRELLPSVQVVETFISNGGPAIRGRVPYTVAGQTFHIYEAEVLGVHLTWRQRLQQLSGRR